jgi:hypothetical protein
MTPSAAPHRPRVLILGDSHTEAIKQAVARSSSKNDLDYSVLRIAKATAKGEVVGNTTLPEALKLIADLQRPDIVVLCLLGTAHNIFGLLQHPEPFDVFLSEMAEPADGLSIVPQNALRTMFMNFLGQDKKLGKVRDTTQCSVFHLSTPPPKADNDFILSKLRNYRGHKVTGITPADTRLKLWALEMSALNEFCSKRGIRFIPPPKDAVRPDGFLKTEYYGGDATHANAEYGKLVLRQLEKLAFEHATPSRTPNHDRSSVQAFT